MVVVPTAVVVVVPTAVVVVVAAVVVVDTGSVVVVVATDVAQEGLTNVSSSSVTAPLRARARPCTVTPLFTVIEVKAITLPTKTEPVPRVAELPTCQNTLQAWAPLISDTVLDEAVMRVESVWKMNTDFGLPPPSRVSGPVRPNADLSGPA